MFEGLYLGNEKSYRKSDLIFGILGPFSPNLDPFTLKIESEHRNRKKSQFWFFDFLKFGWSDFLYIAQSVRGP